MKEKIVNKVYFDVKINTLLPATISYRVLAENAQQASEMIKNLHPNHVSYKLAGRRDEKISVYQAGTNMLLFLKNLFR